MKLNFELFIDINGEMCGDKCMFRVVTDNKYSDRCVFPFGGKIISLYDLDHTGEICELDNDCNPKRCKKCLIQNHIGVIS